MGSLDDPNQSLHRGAKTAEQEERGSPGGQLETPIDPVTDQVTHDHASAHLKADGCDVCSVLKPLHARASEVGSEGLNFLE